MNKVIVYNVHTYLTYANVHKVITHMIIIGEEWVCFYGKVENIVKCGMMVLVELTEEKKG